MKNVVLIATAALLSAAALITSASATTRDSSIQDKSSVQQRGCALPGVQEGENGERIVLDDKAASLKERQAVFRAYEACAQGGDADAQDLVGSLYSMGNAVSDVVLVPDRNKAILYLSNAAAQGIILDMAKMAELGYGAGDYRSALVWAVLFVHYESLLRTGSHTLPNGYSAELLARIYSKIPEEKRGPAIADANSFIAQYDATIRRYVQRAKEGAPTWIDTRDTSLELPSQPVWKGTVDLPFATMVEFLVAFNPDGTASNAWMLYALPDVSVGKLLHNKVLHWKVSPSNQPELRYLRVPIFFNDQRYEVKQAQ